LEKRRLGHAKKFFELAITLLKSFSNFRGIHREKNWLKIKRRKGETLPEE
jgi:hypothetical protein